MGEVIAFINQKGGVGKTTCAASIAAGLRRRGFTTLQIDIDPQSNLTYITGADSKDGGAYELLKRKKTVGSVIQKTPQSDVIAASGKLAADDLLSGTRPENRLKEALEPIRGRYDFILIDCPPTLGMLAINALIAANGAVIPVQADILSLQALGQFTSTFEAVRRKANESLKLRGLILTRYSSRTNLNQTIAEMIEQTAAKLSTKVYKTPIRESVAIREAQAARTDIFNYSPKSKAAADFEALTDEILKDMEGGQ